MTTKHVDQFVHLHSHTHHSILDGHDTVPELVAEVARLGQPAVAITDHGSLSGLYELYTNAKDKGVNPIAGIEAYMTPSTGTRFSREPLYLADGGRGDVAGRGAYTHLTILAINNVGLKNLFQLSLHASTEGFYQKPRVDFALLEKFREGLIVTTSCPSGEVQVWLRNGRYDKAREYTARLIDLFGKENVFVEIMDHGMKQDLERSVRDDLLKLSKDLAIGLLASNDLHYAKKEDAKSHEEMLAIQTRGSMLEPADYDGGKRFAFEGGSYYVKSAAEMAQVFPDHPEALKNTLLIAERASFSVAFDESLKPQVPLPDGYDEDSFLRKEAFEGLARRLPDKANDPVYIARLNTELKVLQDKGFPGYFLVVSDFIRWAKFTAQPKIPMGPGRGCLTAESNILTPSGFKKITDITVGDQVYNQYGNTEKVTETFVYDCAEDLIELKAYFGGQGNKMTADHKVLVSHANRVTSKTKIAQGYRYEKDLNPVEWIRADAVKVGDLVVTPKIKFNEDLKGFDIEPISTSAANTAYEYSIRSIAEKMNISRSALMKYFKEDGVGTTPIALRITDYLAKNNLTILEEKAKRFVHTTSNSYVKANKDLGEIIGLFLSDGWIRQSQDTSVGFAQKASEDEGHIPQLFERVFGMPLRAQASKTSDLIQYMSTHRGIRNFFASLVPNYKFTAGTKYLRADLLNSSEEFRQGLLEGLWYGDGSHKGKSSYSTVSSELAEGVHLLLLSLGLPAGLKAIRRTESRLEYNKFGRDSYTEYKVSTAHNFDIKTMNNSGVGYDEQYTYYRVREINKVQGDGKVYDFTMPETHSYLTDSYVVHNSGAGSLTAYCVDITDADPIRFDLLFERFLNPEREAYPDFDVDVDSSDRERLIQYVKDKYGNENVALVTTFGRIGAKNGLKDVARIYEKPFEVGNLLTKALPPAVFGVEIKLSEVYNPEASRYDEASEFRDLVEKENLQDVVGPAQHLEGRIRSLGVHAAAVIISSKPIIDTIPVYMRQVDEAMITSWDYPTAEGIGLLKMDFLGLRNLGVIRDAVENVKRTRGIDIDVTELSQGLMDDEKTYEMLQRGDSLGVFQLDGGGMRGLLKSLKPTEFEDISALLSLYRPGPMGVNAHTDFALRKNGLQEVIPIHPEFKESLDEILSPTYQLCVAGDTMIWDATKGTLVRIDSIEEEVKRGSFYTFSVNEEGTPEGKKVTHWFDTGVKPIYEIISGDGRTLRVSGDHPVLTLDGYKPASELVAGVDFVASSGQSLPVQQPNNFSVEEARLAGYMIGDGYINLYQNTFTNSSAEILDHVKSLAEKLFDDVYCYSIPRFRNGIHFTNHMQFAANPQGTGKGYGIKGVYETTFKLNRWFKDVLGYTSKTLSRDKFIPEVIFSASEEVIKNFIAGLWDTDGHVNSRFAFFKTISKTLATDLQFLFDRIGIHSYLRPEKTSYVSAKYGDTVPYGLYVYDTRFWNEIVPLLVNTNKASSVKVSSQLSAVDCGVSQLMMKDDMYKVIVEDKALGKGIISRLKNSGTVSLDSIYSYYARNDLPRAATKTQTLATSTMVRMGVNTRTYIENFAGPENLFNSKQRWSKINAITVVQAESVYDITVEDNHNFYANGILVHNCIYQEQIQRIAQVVAGYSLGQADTLRRAMGKKKRYIIDAEFIPFSEGAYARGYSKEAVQALWDILVPFADYAFNKCLSGDTEVYWNAPLGTSNSCTLQEIAEAGLNDDDNFKILAYDEASGTFIWDRVLRIHSNGDKEVHELKLKDSKYSIKSTLDHRHLTNRGWLTLHNIREIFRTEVDSELRILISPSTSTLGLSDITSHPVKVVHAQVESVDYVGVEATYDLEMSAKDHNFVANGIVTHNSHTVAYGITSYITAYLKANYMSEYMAALLSSVSDKTDKTAEYLEDCRAHGIKVNTPDVNQSFVDYAPLSDKEISFGFKAVKGVGEKVADQIVAWRAEHGTFVSVSDFFLRAPKDATNKRVIEALALGGGFDSLDKTRRAIAEGLPETLKVLAKIRKSEAKVKLAPTSLFDMFDDMDLSASDEEAIKKNSDSIFIPELAEYPELEKLKLERQVLGLYVSGHPLAGLDLSGMFSVKIGDLVSTGEGEEPMVPPLEGWAPRDAKGHKIAGIITSLQLKRTKKGDSMAVGIVEDMGASIPFTMFPKVFESFGEYLKLDGVYQLTGFSRRREGEEEISFNVDMVRPLEFSDAGKLSVRVKVTEQQWLKGKDVFVARLEKHRMKGFGTTNIVVSIKNGDGEIVEETVDFTVKTSPVLTSEIRELFGMLAIGRWRKAN